MTAPARAGALAVAAAVVIAACGGDDGREKPLPAARSIDSSGCSPVSYAGKGRPEFLIAAITALQGEFTHDGIQAAQALKLVLAKREWRAGEYRVGLQICDEVGRSGDVSSPAKCRRLARAFARNRSVIAVHGPIFSGCAQEMAPILNRAPRGPLAQIVAGPTYLGLTRSGPGVKRGDPGRYHPTGRRSLVRLAPPDDVQGAAGALFAQRGGARRAFVLNDGSSYGYGVAQAFRVAADRSGIRVIGTSRWDPKARDFQRLATRVRRAGADAVYLGGYQFDNGPRLIRDLRLELGPDAELIGPDGFSNPPTIVAGAGAAADRFAVTIAALPARALPAEGRELAAEFERRFSERPCCYSVHSAEAARIALDALAGSDGTRAQVLKRLFDTRAENGYVGDFEVDRYGDTTLNRVGVYRIEGGRLRFQTAITPRPELLARR